MTQTVIIECSNGKKLKTNPCNNSSIVMGKSQILSKDYSSGSVPDYRHAVETVGESEGFNDSFHADSVDSHTKKRKCMSLNADQSNTFNVPVQFIPASKISSSERSELELKLREELEKVRILQMKIQSRYPVSKQALNHAYAKPTPIPPPVNLNAMVLKQCESLLKNLMQHRYGWVFNTPVDIVKLKIPDYFNIIKHPMDLGTIKKKLASGSYSNPMIFASDVRLTFTNAMTYNPPGNDVHVMADTLNKMFEKKWKPIDQKLAAAMEVVSSDKEIAGSESLSLPKYRKTSMDHRVTIPNNSKPEMPFDEKQELSYRLQSQIDEMPNHIIDFLRQQSHNAKSSEDEIEIDIESLDDDTLFELRRLLDEYFGRKQSAQLEKVKHCEIEIFADSGVSNSPAHPFQVNEPADEDIDIGGDDPPIARFPPVEIEKDTAPSTSSDSGSSSSDSDSGSSSGNDSDKAATPAKHVKENEQPVVAKHLERSDRTISGVVQQEHDACVEANNGSREGENAESETQVSPNKLYRAAQLRNRFADTILKAREKVLNQGEKKDFEKLQREKEEFERQKREEKARLKKEAKAAEEAQRQAEAEVAKKKREFEREAARQALLQMEKTVEINESSLFLKDLEILGTAHGEHIPTAVDEISSDHLGFNIGSNPLEQLGLFRKDDDEEEDECGLTSFPSNNVEDGEIG